MKRRMNALAQLWWTAVALYTWQHFNTLLHAVTYWKLQTAGITEHTSCHSWWVSWYAANDGNSTDGTCCLCVDNIYTILSSKLCLVRFLRCQQEYILEQQYIEPKHQRV